MAWVKTETVTTSPDSEGEKKIAESWSVVDRDGSAALTLAKSGTGTVSMTFDGVLNSSASGAAAGTGVTANEANAGVLRKTVLTLSNALVPMVDEAGVVGYGGLKVYDFPAGALCVLGATANLTVTQTSVQVETATVTAAAGCTGNGNLIVTITAAGLAGSPLNITVPLTTAQNSAALVAAEIRTALAANAAIAAAGFTVGGTSATVTLTKTHTGGPDATLNIDINADDAGTTATGITNAASSTGTSSGIAADWDGDFAIGTTAAGNNNALATTEQNIIPTTATPQATAGATTAKGQSTGILYLDGTATAADAYLNFLIDDADQDIDALAASIVVNGTITILWANLGDY